MNANLKTQAKRQLTVSGQKYTYYSIAALADAGHPEIAQLPFSIKVLLENLLRNQDGRSVTEEDILAVVKWSPTTTSEHEIAFRPARVLMQDFTGVPAMVDLAAMRDAMLALGGDANKINPLSPVDLVIDHSVMVDVAGSANAFAKNVELEFARNGERYEFLRWGQTAFNRFRVVPPGTGICHQVNMEYLAQVVWHSDVKNSDGSITIYPDSLVGTDSHTTMVNGLAVLGWGVGGIEAEAAMLGQPVSMLIPDVVGVRLSGRLPTGVTATDLVLTVTEALRQQGVVGKFVEFFGNGLAQLPLTDRATIANMAPEYGATCGFFPIDGETLRYLTFSGREAQQIKLVEDYAKAQGLWRDDANPEPNYSSVVEIDLAKIEPSLAGPKRPQDRVPLKMVKNSFAKVLTEQKLTAPRRVKVPGHNYEIEDGAVVIAAITSCTNTSNPNVMLAAGLLAQKAVARGLAVKPWVKTSLAPGSQVVTDYFAKAGVQADLDKLGFQTVGYGCTTCIGNSGPLDKGVTAAIEANDLTVAAVLSGNRNFEGRISPHVRANYLASPPLVVAYALAGTVNVDLATEPLGLGSDGKPVFLADIWPSAQEINNCVAQAVTPDMFTARYSNVFAGPKEWQKLADKEGGAVSKTTYRWRAGSTYVQNPPYFEGMKMELDALVDIHQARVLAMLGDSITTDHISPAGDITSDGPAGQWLQERQVSVADFNSYGSRRGNHEIMMRGTFANIRLKNECLGAGGASGGLAKHYPDGKIMSIYEASRLYAAENRALVVVAGKEYGTGSSRDWAAKGTRLLGVKAVLAESFERIHRSNLIGMGVLPLQFAAGESRKTLGLVGDEIFAITGIADGLSPRKQLEVAIQFANGSRKILHMMCRIDTLDELDYYKNGGILPYMLRQLRAA
ncbi:MAG: aconitate hydratase AcnA [Candidatus Symbiobacter sp.]|nr:aconitate hydratase AcnA [Candidatus Symbiobacter sp.]